MQRNVLGYISLNQQQPTAVYVITAQSNYIFELQSIILQYFSNQLSHLSKLCQVRQIQCSD